MIDLTLYFLIILQLTNLTLMYLGATLNLTINGIVGEGEQFIFLKYNQ